MGVVDFDPEKWSRANACDATAGVAKVAKLAEVGRDLAKLSQLSQLSQVAPLLTDVREGVAILGQMKPPRDVRTERWPQVIADAQGLARDGWAAKALALGWSGLDLFGAVTNAAGDPYSDGLAVWLNGRKLLAISATSATVEDGAGRAYYTRREQVGAKLLWELR